MKSVKQNIVLQSTDQHRMTLIDQNNDSLLNREGCVVQMTVIKIGMFMFREQGISYQSSSVLCLNKQHRHILRYQIILHMAWCMKRSR